MKQYRIHRILYTIGKTKNKKPSNMGTAQSSNQQLTTTSVQQPQAQSTNVQETSQNIIFSNSSSKLNEKQIQFIKVNCKKISFINELPEHRIDQLVGKFRICLSNDQWIFKQGSNATYFFIIAQGHVQVIKSGYFIRSLGPGACFGEMALLYGIRRSSSVRVVKQFRHKNIYYCLHKKHFIEAVQHYNPAKTSQFMHLSSNISCFDYLTFRQKIFLAQSSIKITFHKNQRILTKFDQPYATFIITSGKVCLNFKNKRTLSITRNTLFGYYGSNEINCSACAQEQTTVYAIGKDIMNKILGNKIKYIWFWNKVKYSLLQSLELVQLPIHKIQEIVTMFAFKRVKEFNAICRCNTNIDKIYVSIYRRNRSCFGKSSICNNDGQSGRKKSLIGLQQLFKGKDKYQCDFIGNKLDQYAQINHQLLMKFIQDQNFTINAQDRLSMAFNLNKCQMLHIYPDQNKKPSLPQITIYKQPRYPSLLFSVYSAKQTNRSQFASLLNQSKILKNLACLLIQSQYSLRYIHQYKQLQSIRELIPGIYIKQYLLQIGRLPYSICRFYIACIVAVLDYLHNCKQIVIQGQFGLDQCKIDEDRYLCLVGISFKKVGVLYVEMDFNDWERYQDVGNIEKDIYKDKNMQFMQQLDIKANKQQQIYMQKCKSSTKIGKKLLSIEFSKNFKSLGYIAYQLLVGQPYIKQLKDQNPSNNNSTIDFPASFKQKQAKQLIQQLIFAQKQEYICQKIKQLSFFKGIDFKQIFKKQLQSPVIPGTMTIKTSKF